MNRTHARLVPESHPIGCLEWYEGRREPRMLRRSATALLPRLLQGGSQQGAAPLAAAFQHVPAFSWASSSEEKPSCSGQLLKSESLGLLRCLNVASGNWGSSGRPGPANDGSPLGWKGNLLFSTAWCVSQLRLLLTAHARSMSAVCQRRICCERRRDTDRGSRAPLAPPTGKQNLIRKILA